MSADYLPLWNQYIRPLGENYFRLFANSSRASKLLSDVIIPSACWDGSYRSISKKAKASRTHVHAVRLRRELQEAWYPYAFFTNSLELDRGRDLAPKDRTILGKHVVFTYEYDRDELPFFQEQLEWLLPKKAWEKSKIGKLFYLCSEQWADFVGITVAWSGGKSLHIHITFECKTYQSLHPVVGSAHAGLMAHWEMLAKEVQAILKPSANSDGVPIKPDPSLKVPGAFRRLPGGTRLLEKDNLLGMPTGMEVPQVVLWERFRDRAHPKASMLFFQPTKFAKASRIARPQGVAANSISFGNVLQRAEIDYCEDRLREIYTGYPQLDRLQFDDTRRLWIAHFRNSAADRNPSSVMLETHCTVQINGNPSAGTARKLEHPLGEMIKLWLARFRKERRPEAQSVAANDDDLHARHPGSQMISAINGAADADAVRTALEKGLPSLIRLEQMTLLRGPEGSAKTSSIMRRHPQIMQEIDRPGLALYAFGDYANAEEKCDAFNSLSHPGVHGVVWKSFSRTYAEICKELGLGEISYDDAIKAGNQSRWSMVERKQPKVLHALKQRHANMWAAIGDREPVLFTVHDVAYGWRDYGRTRRLWTRSFWEEAADDGQQISETDLAMLVHDEIKISTFVDAIPAEAYDWLQALKARNPAIWDGAHYAVQRETIAEHNAAAPKPAAIEADDHEIRRLLGPGDWARVTTKDTEEYVTRTCDDPAKDVYARSHGRGWYVRNRNWWSHVGNPIAERIVFLTTELVPATVAKRAMPRLYEVDFETPSITRDKVEVRPNRKVVAEKIGSVAQAEWEGLGKCASAEWTVISNRKGTFDPVWKVEVMSHAAARGSNALLSKNIIQTCTFMSPAQYEQVQAINAWTGRDDLVVASHVDEINQTCGRNLGFRRTGAERHILLINRRLYATLEARGAFAGMRYDFELHLDTEERREARRS
ncbi:hypothetical protein WBP06_00505 [Novosphingobium sp. BL-8H]|uniref:hypothetical protein n=1 Tax=Novosphingobium sp. BL-8H TaxID=3127640 RepID=UPI003756BEFA